MKRRVLTQSPWFVTRVIGAYPWAEADTVKALKHIAKYGDMPRG